MVAANDSLPQSDKEKVSLALLVATQLAAYLEGQTGLANVGQGGSKVNQQYAPYVAMNSVQGIPSNAIETAINMAANSVDAEEDVPE
jgi:hypothetical protein